MAFEHIYRPQHKSDTEIVNDFVVRTAVFERIMADIRKDGPGKLSQHHMVQGMRGMGKSTLFERIRVEMKHAELAPKWIAVKTAEENWPVNSLLDFWIWIGQHMASVDPMGFGALGDLGSLWNKDEQHEQCFTTIEAKLKGAKKKLLMLVDNVGDLFRKFSKEENHALRELLVANKYLKLIGGTAVRLDELETHEAPYFDLFKGHHLAGLDQQEVITLLKHYAAKRASKHVQEVVEKEPHRVDHLRILTGGVPRTIMLLLEVFDKDGDASVFDDLRRTLDLVTPLYKHRMDELSPQKQKIVHALAMQWDGMSAGEVASATRLESKTVSAQLGQLVREGFVLRDETSTKNHFYQLAERFFNIWYLMNNAQRNGPQKVRWLTRFFELWCDEKGLKDRAMRHLHAMGQAGLDPAGQVLITNAMLGSDHLDQSTKQMVYERSLRSYPDHADQVLPQAHWRSVEPVASDWRERAWAAIARLDLQKAARLLNVHADTIDPWFYTFTGDIAMLRGELPQARTAFEAGLRISKTLAEKYPSNAQAQRDLSISYDRLGDLLVSEGELPQARKAFEDGLRIRKTLAEKDPSNAQAQRDLSISYDRLGDLLVREGELPQARKAFEDGLRISKTLAEKDPSNAQAQRDLSVSYDRLGDLLVREGELPQARKAFEDGLRIRNTLAEKDPSNAQAQRDLSISFNNLGDLLVSEGELPQARKAFEDSLRISKTLAETDPSNAQAQRDLSISFNKLGDLLVREGELPQARKAFEDGLRISKTLAEKDPSNAQAQRDLSISFNKLGDLLVRDGELLQARKAFEDGLRISKTLAEKDPTNAQAQRDLAHSHWCMMRTVQGEDPIARENGAHYARVVDGLAQRAVEEWQQGDLGDAIGKTLQLTQLPLSTSGIMEALLWALAREQYHGLREAFEVRFPHLRGVYRPVYFALLKLMKDEDPDSHRRMGKELEEPVQQILTRVEEIRAELKVIDQQREKTAAKAGKPKRSAPKK